MDRHLYSPGTNLERSEIAMLETATRSVDVAMYSFTDREVAEVLARLARKGIHVRVYRDREQYQQEMRFGETNAMSILVSAGVEVRVKGGRDLMHLKSYALDGRVLRSGSANWSPTGLKRQDNDVQYDSTAEAVERFEQKFEECGRVQGIRMQPLLPKLRAVSESTLTTSWFCQYDDIGS